MLVPQQFLQLFMPAPLLASRVNRAFAIPASGVWGNFGRGIAMSPGRMQVDFALQKRTRIREFTEVTLRIESFNLANRVQAGNPGKLALRLNF